MKVADVFTRSSQTLAALLLGLAACSAAHAQQIPGYPPVDAFDPREVAMLPRFCIYTQRFRNAVPGGNDPDEISRWKSYFGDTFDHLHHHCLGIMKTNRAVLLSRSQETRLPYLSDAVQEFDYVIAHSPADFVLLPEMLLRRGEDLIRLGKGPLGVLDLERATQLKPDYWPPYAQLSDYYKSNGEMHKARAALEQGLASVPDSPGLKRRLEGLDEKRPSPSKRSALSASKAASE